MKDNRKSLIYTQTSNDATTFIQNEKVGISISNTSTQRLDYDPSNPDRESEIPIVVPNIPIQQAVAAKRKSKKTGIIIFLVICIIVLAIAIGIGAYVKSDKFSLKDFDPTNDLYFTRGEVIYQVHILLDPVDVESFNSALDKKSSLDAFEGATIHYKGKPDLIDYNAVVKDEEIAKVVAGKIYGLKTGTTEVTFYSQDGTELVTRQIDVCDENGEIPSGGSSVGV